MLQYRSPSYVPESMLLQHMTVTGHNEKINAKIPLFISCVYYQNHHCMEEVQTSASCYRVGKNFLQYIAKRRVQFNCVYTDC
jgi:hypothetical protein